MDFLERVLKGFGFDDHLVPWILGCVTEASFTILINRCLTAFFHYTIGLCQGCRVTLSLYSLFSSSVYLGGGYGSSGTYSSFYL